MGDNLTSGLRLAMWCGPRNISTALMRAWGNRPDTFVVDEPLYAHYLRETRLPHAMAEPRASTQLVSLPAAALAAPAAAAGAGAEAAAQ